tara:strand:- start:2166 stop:2903 length:738 start_codon:yes stop_codon:yes gene_type:complete
MLKKRLIITLTFKNGVLYRTKKFIPDYRYTKNFVGLFSIDELILIDISTKKFQESFLKIIKFFSENCFVPISIGGGINSVERADLYFKSGADKIILNSSSLNNKKIINKIEKKYGTQSIIQSIDVRKSDKKFLVYCESGKKKINFEPKQAVDLSLSEGAGEILINNIDLDGSLLGYDLEMIRSVSYGFNCPFLALGGAGNWQHISELFLTTEVSAACTQNIFHFTEESINSAKNFLKKKEINVRH